MRKVALGLAAIAVLLVVTPVASAHRQPPVRMIVVVNASHVPQARVVRAEHALRLQSRQLRRWWGTPVIRFVNRSSARPGAWTVYLVARQDQTMLAFEAQGGVCYGYHSRAVAAAGGIASLPFATVAAVPTITGDQWTLAFSHEVLEMLAPREVADPVADGSYILRGVEVGDFVTPRWYSARFRRGPFDEARDVARAFQTF